jgi:hypothetical protein
MQEVQFPEISLQQRQRGQAQHEQFIYGRELQVSPSPVEPSSRSSRRDVAGRSSPEPVQSPKSRFKNSKFAFRIPLPMTTCSVEEH